MYGIWAFLSWPYWKQLGSRFLKVSILRYQETPDRCRVRKARFKKAGSIAAQFTFTRLVVA
jgi:hypothetical protein